jgi:hypothetical protein
MAEDERLANEDDGPKDGKDRYNRAARTGATGERPPGRELRCFKALGPGHQTRINAVLPTFVRAREWAEIRQDSGKR